MKKLNDLKQCEYAFKIIEALWEMSERQNKKLLKYKEGAEKYIENLEQESHHLKIDNAQLTEQIYNGYKKKVREAK
jgi:hypothetical protein